MCELFFFWGWLTWIWIRSQQFFFFIFIKGRGWRCCTPPLFTLSHGCMMFLPMNSVMFLCTRNVFTKSCEFRTCLSRQVATNSGASVQPTLVNNQKKNETCVLFAQCSRHDDLPYLHYNCHEIKRSIERYCWFLIVCVTRLCNDLWTRTSLDDW